MQLPWRPAVMLVVTAPLDLLLDSAPSPIVTTLVQRFALVGTTAVEQLIDIGGFVVKAADGTPIQGATVNWVDENHAVTTDSQGRYMFVGMKPCLRTLSAAAAGMTTITRNINVPADPPDTHIFKLAP